MKLLTPKEVAAILNCSETYVLDHAKSGDIPSHRFPGKQRDMWRFHPDEIDGYIESMRHQPKQAPKPKRKTTKAATPLLAELAAKRGIKI